MKNPESRPKPEEILDAYMCSSHDESAAFEQFKGSVKILSLSDLADLSALLEQRFAGSAFAFRLYQTVEQEISERLREGKLD